jgi:hypothetical protein
MATTSDLSAFVDVSLSVLIVVVVPIIDNVDIPVIDVVVGELVCCIVALGVVGIGVGGHVRGTQLVLHPNGAVEQSC